MEKQLYRQNGGMVVGGTADASNECSDHLDNP